MLAYSHRLQQIPILSLQTGAELAQTANSIIDPRDLHVAAFYCQGRLLDFSPAVIHTSDIREFSEIGFIVDTVDVIMQPDDLIRLREIIDFNFSLFGVKVVDTTGSKLGTVKDYLIDTSSFLVQKISVKRPLLKSMNTSELLIDREQIVDITNHKITVKSPTVEATAPIEQKTRKSFENPFRNTSPEPEHSTRDSSQF